MARSTWGGLFSGFGRTLAAALTLVVMSGPLAAQTSREIQDLADQVIRRLDLQTEFPVEFPPQPLFTIPSEVLWVVIIIAIVILLYAFRDLIPGLRARQAHRRRQIRRQTPPEGRRRPASVDADDHPPGQGLLDRRALPEVTRVAPELGLR